MSIVTGNSEIAVSVERPTSTLPAAKRWLSAAGATYVVAWLAGLVAAPAAPSTAASAAAVHAYYVEHAGPVLGQSLLVHGVAGLALAALAITIPVATGAVGTLRRVATATGIAAAVVSFAQVAFAVRATTGADTATAGTSQSLFDAVNTADTVKLVLLAGFVAAATVAAHRARLAPRWLRILSAALVLLLPFGGAAFIVDSSALTAMLFVSLPLLLTWAGATAFILGRRSR